MFEELGFEGTDTDHSLGRAGSGARLRLWRLGAAQRSLPAPRPGRTVERLSAGAGRLGDGTGVCDCRNPGWPLPTDLISFEAHRFLASDVPVASALLGGALFGAGMVLTGGCVSRLTVLLGTGNLRALFVLLVFAVTAHAVMKGALAPVREALGAATIHGGEATALTVLPGGEVWPLVLAAAAATLAFFSGARISHLAMAGAIGLLGTAWLDRHGVSAAGRFDPIPVQSMGFTGPMADTLFWTVAATSIPAGFGTGLAAGVLVGSLVAALAAGEFAGRAWKGRGRPGATLPAP